MNNEKILLIEDNETIIELVNISLTIKGYRVSVATSGIQSLNIAQKLQPSLILLDILMPGINGYETCKQLKANNKTKDIPIIFLSALSSTFDKVKAFQFGGVDYLTKPFEVDELISRIETHLTISRLQKELHAANEILEEKVKNRTIDLQQSNEQLVAIMHENAELIEKYKIQNEELLIANKRIAESEEKFKLLFEKSDDAILILSKTKVIECNEAAIQMFGYNKNELINLHPADLSPEKQIDGLVSIEKANMRIQEALESRVNHFEWIHQRKNGELFHASVWLTVVPFQNEKLIHSVVRDITKQKYDEEKIKLQNKELHDLNITKDKFISLLAHDLRSPFNSLIGLTDLLMENLNKFDNEKIATYVKIINTTSKRTFKFLVNLLEWARIQKDGIIIKSEKINLKLLVNEIKSFLDDSAIEKNISINDEIPESIFIYADNEMVKTILRNLLGNAIKFTPIAGSITLSAKSNQTYVEISVSDTGVGMDEKTINSLFKIGETKSQDGTNGEHGTGFGLLLCKEFIEKQSGEIWVESELGKGSTFRFSVPSFVESC